MTTGLVRRLVGSSPYRPVLRHPVLRRLLPGFTLSYLGDAMSQLAVSWLAVQLVPGATAGLWVAAAVAAYTLPGALGTVLFGRAASLPLGFGAPTWLALAAFALGGLIWTPFPATTMAMLQRSTDGASRAPVFAAYSALATLSVPLGTMVGGPPVRLSPIAERGVPRRTFKWWCAYAGRRTARTRRRPG